MPHANFYWNIYLILLLAREDKNAGVKCSMLFLLEKARQRLHSSGIHFC